MAQRDKGIRGEYKFRDVLRKYTGLRWERVPASGALEYLKGDLYVPNAKNLYTIECKNYKDPVFSERSFGQLKSNNLVLWWNKIKSQAFHMQAKPLLLFRHDRSQNYALIQEEPKNTNYIYISWLNAYIVVLDDWLQTNEITFIEEYINE